MGSCPYFQGEVDQDHFWSEDGGKSPKTS